MYINISTCKNDLRDSVHLALVIARMMVLAICTCSPLQITQYESGILFESDIVNFMLLSPCRKNDDQIDQSSSLYSVTFQCSMHLID